MKYETIEELTKALSLQRSVAEKVQNELGRIIMNGRSSFILDASGNPSESSLARVDQEVQGLLEKYLQAPSLLESAALSDLAENSFQGGSFAVAIILGASILSPLAQMVPVLAGASKPLFQFILSEASSPEGTNLKSLQEQSLKNIALKAVDQQTGAEILDAKAHYAVESQVSALVELALEMNLHNKYILKNEDTFTITPLGTRVLAHMVALDSWMKDISEAQATLRNMDTHKLV
jgi:hypothetical protein